VYTHKQCVEAATNLVHSALRRTCRLWYSYTAPAVRKVLAPQKQLRVLMTKEGLETLLALLSKSVWRNCIRCIELVDPGLEALQHQKKDEYVWLGGWRIVCPRLEAMINRVSSTSVWSISTCSRTLHIFRLCHSMLTVTGLASTAQILYGTGTEPSSKDLRYTEGNGYSRGDTYVRKGP
jgi:hypothetical protein